MILTFQPSEELELFAQNEFGFKVYFGSKVFHNVTEIHINYNKNQPHNHSGFRTAIESNIHQTGCTIPTDEIKYGIHIEMESTTYKNFEGTPMPAIET